MKLKDHITNYRSWDSKYFSWILLAVLFIFLFVLAVNSKGTYGEGDDICHYRLTKYAWLFPQFFFDQWNKPVFTLLAFPFSQLGFLGMRLFNICAGLFAAYFTYRTASILKLNNSIYVIILVIFSPVYMSLLLSGMTEILFSFGIMVVIFLFFSEKPISAAIVASFLPFCRIEGFLILPIFITVFLVNKKWKALPFLLVGFVTYSLIGYSIFKDFLWVIHTIPYSSAAAEIYGKGDLFFYIKSAKSIIGLPITFLVIVGLGFSFWQSAFTKGFLNHAQVNIFLLIFFPLVTIVAFHSIAWWLGAGALALTRLMAPIVPLAAIYGLIGYNWLEGQLKWTFLKATFLGIVSYFIVITPFKIYKLPVPYTGEQKVIKAAADWFTKSEYKDKTIYYNDAFVCFFTGLNPFDARKVHEGIPNKNKPEEDVELGSIVFWDAHFSPNEGKVKLTSLMNSPFYKLLRIFSPSEKFTVLGGNDYRMYIFERVKENELHENYEIEKELLSNVENSWDLKYTKEQNYEEVKERLIGLTKNISHTGNYSLKTRPEEKFYSEISFRVNDLTEKSSIRLKASCFVYGMDKESLESATLVTSVQHRKKLYVYKAIACSPDSLKIGSWNEIKIDCSIDEVEGQKDLVKVYIWNPKKASFLIDDLKVECFEKKE